MGWQPHWPPRAGWEVRLFERAVQFSEVGAGVQLGPNAVRCLQAWGLEPALNAVAAFPQHLQVRSATAVCSPRWRWARPRCAATARLRHHPPRRSAQPAAASRARPPGRATQPGPRHRSTTPATPCWCMWSMDGSQAKPVEGDALIGADGLAQATPAPRHGRTAAPAPPGTWPTAPWCLRRRCPPRGVLRSPPGSGRACMPCTTPCAGASG